MRVREPDRATRDPAPATVLGIPGLNEAVGTAKSDAKSLK